MCSPSPLLQQIWTPQSKEKIYIEHQLHHKTPKQGFRQKHQVQYHKKQDKMKKEIKQQIYSHVCLIGQAISFICAPLSTALKTGVYLHFFSIYNNYPCSTTF
jgi:hypothetical protein